MIDERALWFWAHDLHGALRTPSVEEIKRVLEYAYAFGTVIPERFLIDAFQACFKTPLTREVSREVLVEMGMVPKA